MAAPRVRSRSARRRGPVRALLLLLVLLLLGGAAVYVLLPAGGTGGQAAPPSSGGTSADGAQVAASLFDDVEENADGSLTVTVSEAQTAALVAAGLARSSGPTLRDVAVDLVTVEGGPPGRMIVTGRLADQPVPVRATVDLDVADSSVRPTVRAVRVGPLGVPPSVRRDLDRQLKELVSEAAQGVAVSELRTTDTALVLTGERT